MERFNMALTDRGEFQAIQAAEGLLKINTLIAVAYRQYEYCASHGFTGYSN